MQFLNLDRLTSDEAFRSGHLDRNLICWVDHRFVIGLLDLSILDFEKRKKTVKDSPGEFPVKTLQCSS